MATISGPRVIGSIDGEWVHQTGSIISVASKCPNCNRKTLVLLRDGLYHCAQCGVLRGSGRLENDECSSCNTTGILLIDKTDQYETVTYVARCSSCERFSSDMDAACALTALLYGKKEAGK